MIVDGEIVALGPDHRPSFGALQKRTRAQVIDCYAAIAPVLLPHLRDRPVALRLRDQFK